MDLHVLADAADGLSAMETVPETVPEAVGSPEEDYGIADGDSLELRTSLISEVEKTNSIMARRNQRRNHPNDITDHRFLQFPRSLNNETRGKYLNTLSLLLTKEIDIAPSFDWGLASQTGLDERIQNFLQYTYLDASGVSFFL
ncbi:unnamed protein product [Lactuca saligna]|uniref:Uncharacterized protein n=1 Tax=Lactuca saligna TaxID=75948 RepID=A0AA35ZJA4_LACSI|nr:unnamed protein product [Lactuca saligna]